MVNDEYSIVVVEDEQAILKNIVNKIESIDDRFKVKGIAYNGEEAMKVIRDVKPDILFTDIKMPVMDGLELARNVRSQYPDLQIVIMSGYNEFNYAQQALKLGVMDYMLKPVKIEALTEVLKSIKLLIDDRTYKLENNILASNINGLPSDIELTNPLINSDFLVFLICIGNLHNYVDSSLCPIDFRNFWSKKKWQTILQGMFKDLHKWWLIDDKMINQRFLILSSGNKKTKKNIPAVAEALKKALSADIYPFTVNICLNPRVISYSEIMPDIRKLRITLEQNLIIGESKILDCSTSYNYFNSPLLDDFVINKIKSLIHLDKRNILKQELFNLFTKWDNIKLPQRYIEKTLQQLLRIFREENQSITGAEIYQLEYELYNIIALSPDFRSIYDDIWNQVENLLATSCEGIDGTRELADKIESYIRQNFTRQINLVDMSNKFNLHPIYLSRIFKRYKEETPLRYLITLRIEEAKRLIYAHPNLDLKDIGNMLGYSDQYYFSRIFKQITNESPSDYKKSQAINHS